MALVMTERYTGSNRIRNFYSNRILRLYPTYFIALVLMLGVEFYLNQRTGGKYMNAWQADHAALPRSAKVPLIIPNIALVGSDLPWMFITAETLVGIFVLAERPPTLRMRLARVDISY
jgi:peptidoglycan/LPS O-acetylase OafA/YrhL